MTAKGSGMAGSGKPACSPIAGEPRVVQGGEGAGQRCSTAGGPRTEQGGGRDVKGCTTAGEPRAEQGRARDVRGCSIAGEPRVVQGRKGGDMGCNIACEPGVEQGRERDEECMQGRGRDDDGCTIAGASRVEQEGAGDDKGCAIAGESRAEQERAVGTITSDKRVIANEYCNAKGASRPISDDTRVEVINQSGRKLTDAELSVLGKGLTFVPSKRQPVAQLLAELKEWERLMRLREYWDGQENGPDGGRDNDSDTKYKQTRWTPPKGRDPWLDLYIEEVSGSVIRGLKKRGKSNLSRAEDEALLSLMKDDSIIIRPADKGSSFVIMNRDDYISRLAEEIREGDGYEETNGDITSSVARKVGKVATRLEEKGYIGKNQRRYLIPPRPVPGTLQGNPKIHKKGAPMRTVVSGRGHATEQMAALAEAELNEHVESQDSYIKDTGDFLNKLQSMHQPITGGEGGHKPLLFCMDVAKLYPSVPRAEGVAACRSALDARSAPTIPTEEMLKVVELVLDNNNFQLGETRNYLQIEGTAIGSKLGRNYACTYMGAWETELLSKSFLKPLKWFRFIDDIWGIWVHGEDTLRDFHTLANQIHPSIKVDLRSSSSSIEFLDVEVLLSESGYLTTNLYTKPTDARAYLHYASDHPPCVKRAIPRGLGMRIKRICSNQRDYHRHKQRLFDRLKERGYPAGELSAELEKVDRMERADLLGRTGRRKGKKEDGRVPMVVTFSSFLPDIRAIMRENRYILKKSSRLSAIFQKDPMVAFKRGSNLKDLLVHKKTRDALRTRGRQDCGGGCAICRVFYEGDMVPGAGGPMHYDKTIGCRTSNLVYGIWCAKCRRVVYVGQTGDTIYTRAQNHLSSIRCRREGRIPVSRHFWGEGHDVEDLRIIGLERAWGNSEDRRKFREMRWVGLLGTQRDTAGENVRRER